MSPESQRIAILEFQRWTKLEPAFGGIAGIPPGEKSKKYVRHAPDPLSDLNAMHDAEKMLTDEQSKDYAKILDWVCEAGEYSSHFATAPQRAEAFLRTIGRWEGA